MFDTLINAGIYLLGFTKCRRLQVFSALVLIFKKSSLFLRETQRQRIKKKSFLYSVIKLVKRSSYRTAPLTLMLNNVSDTGTAINEIRILQFVVNLSNQFAFWTPTYHCEKSQIELGTLGERNVLEKRHFEKNTL